MAALVLKASQAPLLSHSMGIYIHLLYVQFDKHTDSVITIETTICVEIFEVHKFLWISWYASYPQKLIHNN